MQVPYSERAFRSSQPLRECATKGCGPRDPAGGITLGQGKWYCAVCWRKINARKKQ